MKGRLNSNRFFQFTKNVLGRHTGEAIAKKIEQLLKEVPHVENLEVVVVHDSAANMKNGMEGSSIIHRSFLCSDHLLNFAISGAVTAPPFRSPQTLMNFLLKLFFVINLTTIQND